MKYVKWRALLSIVMAAAIAFTALPVSAEEAVQNSYGIQQAVNTVIETEITDKKPELQGENVALNKAVESTIGCHVDRPVTAVTNGIRNQATMPSSFAQIQDWGGEWNITVDLGESFSIEAIAYGKYAEAYNANVKTYQIQVSEDKITWMALGELQREETVIESDIYFVPQEPVSARYVRLHAPEAAPWQCVDELEVYSTDKPAEPQKLPEGFQNIAYGGEASISQPVHVDHNSAALAIDGDLDTYVTANYGQPFDFILAFPEKGCRFNTVVLRTWYYKEDGSGVDQRVKKFSVQVSEDGEQWKTVGEHEMTSAELKTDCVYTLENPVETKYVKLVMLQADAWVAINEFELYDTTTVPNVISEKATGSTVLKGEQIALSAYEGAQIWYTTDGSDPKTSGTVQKYDQPIEVTNDLRIRAYAKKEGMLDSAVAEFIYHMRRINVNPESGLVEKGTLVELVSLIPEAEIIYTIDGSDPTLSNSAKIYEDPIEITGYTEVQAYLRGAQEESPVYTFTYSTGNAALEAAVSTNTEVEGHLPAAAVDGKEETYWKPSEEAHSWLMFDMGEPFDYASIQIQWLNSNAGYKYVIETSSDLKCWYYYDEQRSGTNMDETHTVIRQESHRRYIRIRILGAAAGQEIGIREVNITGRISKSGARVPMYDLAGVTDIYDRPVVNPIPDEVLGVEEPVIRLNGEWQFLYSKENDYLPDGFWKNSVAPSGWSTIKLPAEPDYQGFPAVQFKNREMVYKKQVLIPEDYEGNKVFLRINKAVSYARVWVNGQFVREHRGEYNTWDADITDYVIPGQENWITIGVTEESNREFSNWEMMGLNYPGILGDVDLYVTPDSYLNRLHYKTDLDETYTDATLTVMGNAFLEDGATGVVELSMKDMDGNPVELSVNRLELSENFTDYELDIPIENPEKWDAEHPNLYEVTAQFKVDGQTVETIVQKIGFREVEVKVGDDGYKKFMVNGVSTKLRGVNYLAVYGNDGLGYDIEAERMLLEKLKAMNVNFIRAAHFPRSTETLELCDELGIFVEQENAICFGDMFNRFPDGKNDPDFHDYIVGTAAEMVEKDMSHPCIVMWSLGNESFWGSNHKDAARYVKAVDPTTPTIFSYSKLMTNYGGAEYPGQTFDDHEETDLFSSHYLDAESEYNYFDKPIIWDEYAHNYYGNEGQIMTDPGVRQHYYEIIRYNWEKMYNHPQRFGGAIWDFTDNVAEGKNSQMGNTCWGMVDAWGREKPEYWAVKTVYAPPQYKGEDAVALPEAGEALKLFYENRYETVAFDDEDFEIRYFINGEEAGTLDSRLAPKESGYIKVPAPEEGWKLGDTIRLEFYKTTRTWNGDIRRIVVADEITIGQPDYTVSDSTKDSPVITETDTSVAVQGEDFQIDFSKATGLITEGTYKGELVLTGGPHLSNNQGNPGNWALKSIKASTEENEVVVVIDGSYDSMGCTYTLRIDAEGKIETTYALTTGGFSTLEIGVAYDMPATVETISWLSKGYAEQYQEDQACRPEGTAYKELEWKREWGVKPPENMGWKDYDKEFYGFGRGDQGGRGTNDFRSSKIGFYYAQLGLQDSDVMLSVYGGEGNGSIRPVMNADKTVRVNINTAWGYPVTQSLSNAPARYVSVPANHSGTVVMKLTDVKDDYRVDYKEVEEVSWGPFIKPIGAIAGSTWVGQGQVKAENVINGVGMSGTTSFEDTHDNDAIGATMWHTGDGGLTKAWFQVDLGMVYALDEMWIWNENQGPERGFKNVKIEYSEDGKIWKELQPSEGMVFQDTTNSEYPFQFAPATGQADCPATNLNDGENSPVSFDGARARYVKLTAAPTAGDGNWGENGSFGALGGLSELRFTGMEEPEEPEDPLTERMRELLREAIAYAKNQNTDDVTEAAKAYFEKALGAAETVVGVPEATFEQLQSALLELMDAVNGLGVTKGDKTVLKILIDQAELLLLNAENYVAEYWPKLLEAFEAAKTVYDDGNALEEDIKSAEDALLEAILAQRLKANKSNLEKLIQKAEAMDISGYTEQSVAAFQNALVAAKAVAADKSLSEDDQAQVDKAEKELNEAIEALVKADDGGDGNTDGDNTDDGNKDDGDNTGSGTGTDDSSAGTGGGTEDGNIGHSNAGGKENGGVANQPGKTGDFSPLVLWSVAGTLALLALLAGGSAGWVTYRKRKMSKDGQ